MFNLKQLLFNELLPTCSWKKQSKKKHKTNTQSAPNLETLHIGVRPNLNLHHPVLAAPPVLQASRRLKWSLMEAN